MNLYKIDNRYVLADGIAGAAYLTGKKKEKAKYEIIIANLKYETPRVITEIEAKQYIERILDNGCQ